MNLQEIIEVQETPTPHPSSGELRDESGALGALLVAGILVTYATLRIKRRKRKEKEGFLQSDFGKRMKERPYKPHDTNQDSPYSHKK